jgi:hypothetical protein
MPDIIPTREAFTNSSMFIECRGVVIGGREGFFLNQDLIFLMHITMIISVK